MGTPYPTPATRTYRRLPSGAVRLRPLTVQVYCALLRVWRRDGRATVRAVAQEASYSIATTHGALVDLHLAGLVGGVGEGVTGALRPLYVPVFAL